ncbi:MAG: hypothetical protein ACXABY_29220 [Candidatus Thorarchaeota archaeon]|jgi:hypothetical protein
MTDVKVFELKGLTDDFDDDLAKSILDIQLSKAILPQEAVEKSLYNFDLETPEGVDRLLELLPILDPEIMGEVYQEIFPGYPVDTLAPRMLRLELRGYFMDYLEDAERQKAGQEAAEAREAGAGELAEITPPEEAPPEALEEPEPEGLSPVPEQGAEVDQAEDDGAGTEAF